MKLTFNEKEATYLNFNVTFVVPFDYFVYKNSLTEFTIKKTMLE